MLCLSGIGNYFVAGVAATFISGLDFLMGDLFKLYARKFIDRVVSY